MVRLIAGGTALLLTGGIAVIGAQHLTHSPSAPPEMLMMHHGCPADSADGQGATHVPDHLAKMLDLSAEQTAELDAKGAEACRIVSRLHDGMLQVLTPEQRTRMEDLHRSHGSAGLHAWLKKLHGR